MSHSFIRSFEFPLGGAVLNLLLPVLHSSRRSSRSVSGSLPLLRLRTEEDLFTCSGPVGSEMGSCSGSFSGSENCRKYFVSCKPLFTYTWFSKDLLSFFFLFFFFCFFVFLFFVFFLFFFSRSGQSICLVALTCGGYFWNRWLLKCCFVICRVILRSWFWLVVYFADDFSQTCSDLMTLIFLSSRGSLLAIVNCLFCSGRLEQSKKLVKDDVKFKIKYFIRIVLLL